MLSDSAEGYHGGDGVDCRLEGGWWWVGASELACVALSLRKYRTTEEGDGRSDLVPVRAFADRDAARVRVNLPRVKALAAGWPIESAVG